MFKKVKRILIFFWKASDLHKRPLRDKSPGQELAYSLHILSVCYTSGMTSTRTAAHVRHGSIATVVALTARNLTATVTHAYSDNTRDTRCGRTIGEEWAGEYSEALPYGLPTCQRCMVKVQAAHDAIVAAADFRIGQRVEILGGALSVNGPYVTDLGTVVQIQETWKGVTEYSVRADRDGMTLLHRTWMIRATREARTVTRGAHRAAVATDSVELAACKAAHPAGKGRAVRLPVGYAQTVPVPFSASVIARMDGASQDEWDALADSLSGNPWNV